MDSSVPQRLDLEKPAVRRLLLRHRHEREDTHPATAGDVDHVAGLDDHRIRDLADVGAVREEEPIGEPGHSVLSGAGRHARAYLERIRVYVYRNRRGLPDEVAPFEGLEVSPLDADDSG